MAELRLKPNFFDFMDEVKKSAITRFDNINSKYKNSAKFHRKIPSDLYFAKTSFDIYTFTLFLTLMMFGLMLFLKFIFRLFRHKNRVINFLF